MKSSSSSTLNRLVLSSESATKEQFQVDDISRVRVRRPLRSSKGVQNAVYAYIRAIRALGRTRINTSEIADALSLPIPEVNRALSSLKRKGVRALNG
jgi:DNA-binding MarR family transcriptional regulator